MCERMPARPPPPSPHRSPDERPKSAHPAALPRSRRLRLRPPFAYRSIAGLGEPRESVGPGREAAAGEGTKEGIQRDSRYAELYRAGGAQHAALRSRCVERVEEERRTRLPRRTDARLRRAG